MKDKIIDINKMIDSSKNIFIMGHKDLDLDAIGSALAINDLLMIKGINSTIIIDDELHEPAVKKVLEETPPELAADIISKGIILTGGGALIDGFSELLSKELNVPIYIAESPLTCVAEGTGLMLNNLYLIKK